MARVMWACQHSGNRNGSGPFSAGAAEESNRQDLWMKIF
jgi:hypothetical protein